MSEFPEESIIDRNNRKLKYLDSQIRTRNDTISNKQTSKIDEIRRMQKDHEDERRSRERRNKAELQSLENRLDNEIDRLLREKDHDEKTRSALLAENSTLQDRLADKRREKAEKERLEAAKK